MQNSNLLRLFEDLSIISTNEQRIELLERIHIEVSNISSSIQFEQVHQHVPWSLLFEFFQLNNDEIERLLCAILEHFITNLSIEQIMNDFYPLLNIDLDPNRLSQRTILLCLKAFDKLSRCSTNDCFFVIQSLFQHANIHSLLRLFLDSEQQTLWLKSKHILEQMIRTISQIQDKQILDIYLRDHYFHQSNRQLLLRSSIERNEIVKLRIYEYLIDLCLIDARVYEHITDEQHLLDRFLHDCTHSDKDILYLMNCLELLTSLTAKPHTLNYLQNKTNVIEHFFRLLLSNHQTGEYDLLQPAFIKFFGCYLRNYLVLLETSAASTNGQQQQLLERFLPFLFDILLQSNSHIVIGLDTIGFIGKTLPGKAYMIANAKFGDVIEKLIQMIRQAQSEIRVRALLCLTDLFYLSVDDRLSPIGWSHTEHIYRLCNRTFALLPLLIQIAKQPFVDLRLGAYRCLFELIQSPWSLNIVNDEPGFIEFLLNRSTERDKDGKEIKFAIVKTLCHNDEQAKAIFGNVTYLKLRRYVNEGAFYVEPQANVAFDGSNE